MHIRNLIRLIGVSIGLIWLGAAVPLAAAPSRHPAPSVMHDYLLALTAHDLRIDAYLRVSPELVPEVYRGIDSDSDGTTSLAEQQRWEQTHASKISVSLDGVPVALRRSTAPDLSRAALLSSIGRPLVLSYRATLTDPLQGKHRLRLSYGDSYLTYDEYYLSIVGDRLNDTKPRNITRPQYPATYQVIYQLPQATSTVPADMGQLAPAPFTAGGSQQTPSMVRIAEDGVAVSESNINLGAEVSVPPATPADIRSGGALPVLDRLRNWHGSFWSAFLMLMLALGIGALHALTPGHGKAVVAAYLIGTRGRVRDAVMLGSIVTITHTFGVVVLGVVLLLFSSFSLPRTLQPALQLLSGLLIVVLGLSLVIHRLRQLHTTSLEHEHTHDHTHSHDGHIHTHAGHTHSHGGHTHTHAIPTAPHNLRALIGLGVSGGLVPCPDALAILLLAAGVGQIGLGLSLVLSFSIGLAAVLMAIGIVLVKMKAVLEHTNLTGAGRHTLWVRWVPLASAVVVVLVGLLMTLSSLQLPWS